MGPKHCNTAEKNLWIPRGIILKNKPHLVTFHESILANLVSFSANIYHSRKTIIFQLGLKKKKKKKKKKKSFVVHIAMMNCCYKTELLFYQLVCVDLSTVDDQIARLSISKFDKHIYLHQK